MASKVIDRDLNKCEHIVLTSLIEWNPHKVEFPCLTQSEVNEIEGCDISDLQVERKEKVNIAHSNPCLQPVKTFGI